MIEQRELIWFDAVDLFHLSERTSNTRNRLLGFRWATQTQRHFGLVRTNPIRTPLERCPNA
jgi:hypothetical protein